METLNILHIDCDAFFASCEQLRHPEYKNKPMAVGGLSNKSIITTANYKAREFGLHSGMPVFMAKDLCPDIILLPVDRAYYIKKSKEVFNIVKGISLAFEQVSIDEAYIEVEKPSEPYKLAGMIQKKILKETGLTVSIGVSYNKFLAKIASDRNKPMGIKLISRSDIPTILLPLDISKVHGLGKKGSQKLKSFGVYKVADLMRLDEDFLIELFGKQGSYIYNVIRGVDNRPVGNSEKRKSLGRETTLMKNTRDRKILNKYLISLSKELEIDLEKTGLMGKTINLKLKDEDFNNHTRSLTLQEPIYTASDIYQGAGQLLKDFKLTKEIRLIGISLSKLSDRSENQLSFL